MKYRKRPIVIEAIQWNGYNIDEVTYFMKPELCHNYGSTNIVIDTLEGTMLANIGDYIIRGINGELYPCKPDIFEKTYEKVK